MKPKQPLTHFPRDKVDAAAASNRSLSLSKMTVVPLWLMLLALVRTMPRSTTPIPKMVEAESYFPDDAELVRQADQRFNAEQLLAAARTLRRVKDPRRHLTAKHLKVLKIADLLENALADFLAPPGSEWKKQGESHGVYDTSIYYKIESGGRLTCRIETPIPKDMIVPILCVLNESSLYRTWIPSWTRPIRLGVRESRQLANDRKGHQVINITCDVPWPMAPRDVLMDVIAVDDIEESGCIIAKMQTLDPDSKRSDAFMLPEGFEMPPLEKGSERVDFDGSILFRACPMDHPNYKSSRQKLPGDLVLLQYSIYFDAKMAVVPSSMINFITRVVIGMVWSNLLKVAEEVKNGERREHLEVIRQKADFYQWLEDRCQLLLDNNRRRQVLSKPASTLAFVDDSKNAEWTMQDVMRISI